MAKQLCPGLGAEIISRAEKVLNLSLNLAKPDFMPDSVCHEKLTTHRVISLINPENDMMLCGKWVSQCALKITTYYRCRDTFKPRIFNTVALTSKLDNRGKFLPSTASWDVGSFIILMLAASNSGDHIYGVLGLATALKCSRFSTMWKKFNQTSVKPWHWSFRRHFIHSQKKGNIKLYSLMYWILLIFIPH